MCSCFTSHSYIYTYMHTYVCTYISTVCIKAILFTIRYQANSGTMLLATYVNNYDSKSV